MDSPRSSDHAKVIQPRTTSARCLSILFAALALLMSPLLLANIAHAAGSEAKDPEGGGHALLTVTTTKAVTARAVTKQTATTIPGCKKTSKFNCRLIMRVHQSADRVLTGSAATRAISTAQSNALPGVRIFARGRYCLPTGCYRRVIAKSWNQDLCFVMCSAVKANHHGRFYRTPDGKYVWETVRHGGVVGFHACQVEHSMGVGVDGGKERPCTAPRYGRAAIHSHYWVKITAMYSISELFLGSACHHGNGTTTFHTYSY